MNVTPLGRPCRDQRGIEGGEGLDSLWPTDPPAPLGSIEGCPVVSSGSGWAPLRTTSLSRQWCKLWRVTNPKAEPEPIGWLSEHIGILVAAAPVLLVLVRVARVAGFDKTTGYALIARGSAFAILGGALLDFVPAMLVITALALAAVSVAGPRTQKSLWRAAAAFVAIPTVVNVPVDSLLAVGILAVIVGTSLWFDRSTGAPAKFDSRLSAVVLAVGAVTLFVLATDDPWLPAESLELTGGETVTAYVVEREDDVTTILQHHPRVVRIIPSDEIIGRTICAPEPSVFWYNAPRLLDVIRRQQRPRPPRCPE